MWRCKILQGRRYGDASSRATRISLFFVGRCRFERRAAKNTMPDYLRSIQNILCF